MSGPSDDTDTHPDNVISIFTRRQVATRSTLEEQTVASTPPPVRSHENRVQAGGRLIAQGRQQLLAHELMQARHTLESAIDELTPTGNALVLMARCWLMHVIIADNANGDEIMAQIDIDACDKHFKKRPEAWHIIGPCSVTMITFGMLFFKGIILCGEGRVHEAISHANGAIREIRHGSSKWPNSILLNYGLAKALVLMSQIQTVVGDHQARLAAIRESVEIFEEHGLDHDWAYATCELAEALFAVEEVDQARDLLVNLLRVPVVLASERLQFRIHLSVADSPLEQFDPPLALESARRLPELASSVRHQALAYEAVVRYSLSNHDYDRVLRCCDALETVSVEDPILRDLVSLFTASKRTLALAGLGEWDQAMKQYRSWSTSMNRHSEASNEACIFASVLLEAGRLDDATSVAHDAFRMADAVQLRTLPAQRMWQASKTYIGPIMNLLKSARSENEIENAIAEVEYSRGISSVGPLMEKVRGPDVRAWFRTTLARMSAESIVLAWYPPHTLVDSFACLVAGPDLSPRVMALDVDQGDLTRLFYNTADWHDYLRTASDGVLRTPLRTVARLGGSDHGRHEVDRDPADLLDVLSLHAPGVPLAIVPAAFLFYVPFGALLSSAEGEAKRHLLTDHRIVYLDSLRRACRIPAPEVRRALLIAPSDDATHAPPQAMAEMREVERLLNSHGVQTSTLGLPADLEEISRRLETGDFDLLHVASHGSFNRDYGIDSGMTAGRSSTSIERDREDRLHITKSNTLSVATFAQAKLDGAIVILAGCFSGQATNIPFHGISISQAAIAAGASHVVGNLWQVGDRWAKNLSIGLYSRFLSGQDLGSAIRQMQLLDMGDTPLVQTREVLKLEDVPHPGGERHHFWAGLQHWSSSQ